MRTGHRLRGVSYYGTIVVGRPTDILPHQPGIELFGLKHQWLRDLGDGWQLLETSAWDDPSGLNEAAAGLARSTGAPALAAHVLDVCATLHIATPDGNASCAHYEDVTRPCNNNMAHCPQPVGRPVEGVTADLLTWARAAGWSPSEDAVGRVVTFDRFEAEDYRSVDESVFDLVMALGAQRIGRTRASPLTSGGRRSSALSMTWRSARGIGE
jgi:hypothetical protein